jgi:hypothetical protein
MDLPRYEGQRQPPRSTDASETEINIARNCLNIDHTFLEPTICTLRIRYTINLLFTVKLNKI